MEESRNKPTKDVTLILISDLKKLDDQLDQMEKDTKELRDDIDKYKRKRLGL